MQFRKILKKNRVNFGDKCLHLVKDNNKFTVMGFWPRDSHCFDFLCSLLKLCLLGAFEGDSSLGLLLLSLCRL